MAFVFRSVMILALCAGVPPFGASLGAMDRAAEIAQATAPGSGQSLTEPTSPRVGRVRRNAQGEIELVPDAPPAARPAAAPEIRAPDAPPPRPGGLPPAPAAVAPVAPQQPAATARVAARPTCDGAVLLCMQVNSTADTEQAQVPLTFGHPLAAGLLKPGEPLGARFGGSVLPLQIDQVARHADGSIRFAVFSTVLPRLAARAQARLEIVKGSPTVGAPAASISSVAPELRVEIETFAPQIVNVMVGSQDFGDGPSFRRGERVTLALGDPVESFTVVVTPEMEGTQFRQFRPLAAALASQIARSPTYTADHAGHWLPQGIIVTTRDKTAKAFPVRVIYDGAGKIYLNEAQKWAPRQRHIATLGPGAAGSPWLDGPIVREVYANVPLRAEQGGREHPALTVLAGIRRYAGVEAVRFDVALDNASILPDELRNFHYDATVRIGDVVRFEVKGLEHYAMSRWHRLFWSGQTPQFDRIHDRARLLESRALPPYDPDLRISAGAIGRQVEQLRRSNTAPMGNAFIMHAFGTTGGRPDIGPLPLWSALHALSLDPGMERVVLANGDASGSVPIHLSSDPKAGVPMNVKQFPGTRLRDGRMNLGSRTVHVGWARSPFSPDIAHQPSLAYYPYLLTGDRFYLDELHYWASYNALVQPVDSRQGGLGVFFDEQVRGQAWGLRTLAEAALVTADRHPMKPVFQEQLKANMAAYLKRHLGEIGEGGPGVNHAIIDIQREKVAPWQQDMMAMVVAHLAENGVEGAERLARWMAPFVVGRWNAESQGYCRANAPGYWLLHGWGKPITWAEFNRLNWPDQRSCAGVRWNDPNPDCAYCYTSIARAALASMLNIGIAEAREPYDFIRLRTPNSMANMAAEPTFALAPRKP